MRRSTADTRYSWDRTSQRVQPLRTGVRLFDHRGRGIVVTDLADLCAFLVNVTAADPECGARIVAQLDEHAPGAVAACQTFWGLRV